MNDTDIVIYEKDSVDVKFTLDSNNSTITSFSASDTIIFALKLFRGGSAVIQKEVKGITGTSVTFSLTRQETEKLNTHSYVYDVAVQSGETLQTTVLKSARFIISNKPIETNDSTAISLDKVAEMNLLVNQNKGYSESVAANVVVVNTKVTQAETLVTEAQGIKQAASSSATSASSSATLAASSASAAGDSANAASASAASASASKTSAAESASNAYTYSTNAASSATSASTYAANAKTSEDNAKASETQAAADADILREYISSINRLSVAPPISLLSEAYIMVTPNISQL